MICKTRLQTLISSTVSSLAGIMAVQKISRHHDSGYFPGFNELWFHCNTRTTKFLVSTSKASHVGKQHEHMTRALKHFCVFLVHLA